MGVSVKIVGLEKLQRKLKRNASLRDVKTVVQMNGKRLEERIKQNTKTAFSRGYSEGFTADSASGRSFDDGLSYEAGIGMDYNPYTEYGTRHMEPEPVVTPAFEEVAERFRSDMKRIGD